MWQFTSQRVQFTQDGVELLFQAGDSLVESRVATRRTDHWTAGRTELWPAGTETPTKSTTTEAAASRTAESARSWAETFRRSIPIAARFRTAIGATVTGSAVNWGAITGSACFRTVVAIARRAGFTSWWRSGVAILLGDN
jgi:hypothetical protein